MRIDPHAWLLTFPMTIGLAQLYLLPAESFAKRCWRRVNQAEAIAWQGLGGRKQLLCEGSLARKAAFALMFMGLLMSSLASFAAFIGWVSTT